MEYEITWKNFTEQLPGVVASIKSADFIAVDAEMSGLQRNEIGRGGSNDSLQLRYAVMRDSVHNYLAFQWGICTFHFDATKQEYTARPYNFYIFRRGSKKWNLQYRVQADCMEFLATTGFDFNKVIYDGIPFLTRQEEQEFKEEAAGMRVADVLRSSVTLSSLNGDFGQFINTLARILGKWPHEQVLTEEDDVDSIVSHAGKDEEGNPFLLLSPVKESRFDVIAQAVGHHAPLVHCSKEPAAAPEGKVIIRLTKCPTRAKVLQLQHDDIEQAVKHDFKVIDDHIGFRRVIEALVAAKAPIVAHNCSLDFLHLYHILHGTLPDSVADFVTNWREMFPYCFDTKFIIDHVTRDAKKADKALPWVGTRLEEMVEGLERWDKEECRGPNIQTPSVYATNTPFHDAGYDAYITGYAFVKLLAFSDLLPSPISSINTATPEGKAAALLSLNGLVKMNRWSHRGWSMLNTPKPEHGGKAATLVFRHVPPFVSVEDVRVALGQVVGKQIGKGKFELYKRILFVKLDNPEMLKTTLAKLRNAEEEEKQVTEVGPSAEVLAPLLQDSSLTPYLHPLVIDMATMRSQEPDEETKEELSAEPWKLKTLSSLRPMSFAEFMEQEAEYFPPTCFQEVEVKEAPKASKRKKIPPK